MRTLSVAIACILSAPVAAQSTGRIPIPRDSFAVLTRDLLPASRAAAETYVHGTDSSARIAMRVLRSDRPGQLFLVAVLPSEPSVAFRQTMMGLLRTTELLEPVVVRAALQERVRNEQEVALLKAAVDALRAVALRETGMESLMAERIGRARAEHDTLRLRLFLEMDESHVHAERPVDAPAFVRTPPPPFAVAPAERPVRVLAFGDYGTAHLGLAGTHQADVAAAIRAYHAQNPFTFGITTGDNFYPTSFASPNDPSWKVSWEDMYGPLGIPFYISLGNHDWGERAGPLGEFIYGVTSRSWKLPALYYTFTAGPAQFFALNTNALTARQLEWLRTELSRSTARWKIVYGHHPAYEQTDYGIERQRRLLLPILRDNKVDMYLAGHHHTIQHWQVDGIDYVVTGAGGASNYTLGDTTRAAGGRRFIASRPAFADLVVNDAGIRLRFVGLGPTVLYDYTRRR